MKVDGGVLTVQVGQPIGLVIFSPEFLMNLTHSPLNGL